MCIVLERVINCLHVVVDRKLVTNQGGEQSFSLVGFAPYTNKLFDNVSKNNGINKTSFREAIKMTRSASRAVRENSEDDVILN